jgi:hypothetical protein
MYSNGSNFVPHLESIQFCFETAEKCQIPFGIASNSSTSSSFNLTQQPEKTQPYATSTANQYYELKHNRQSKGHDKRGYGQG